MDFLAKRDWKILTQPDNIWVRIVKARYLKNGYSDFLTTKESSATSNAWKSILHTRSLLNKGLKWIIGNRNKINF